MGFDRYQQLGAALNDYDSGVAEADLAAIRRQAPMLVSKAAEAERIDWNGFLNQGRQWLQQSLGSTATA